jgi:hypothetical protein
VGNGVEGMAAMMFWRYLPVALLLLGFVSLFSRNIEILVTFSMAAVILARLSTLEVKGE